MKFVDRKGIVPLPTVEERAEAKINWSTKMDPYVDNEHTILGYTRCTSNALADVDRNDYARRAMRKDSK